ncbi:MAG: gamma carbonic anhydrase family protein [Myxococcales bacterium]|nr:gamma carbonic anhydrase family protein [Myxococcales bacterium]
MDPQRLDPARTRVHPSVFVAQGAIVVGEVALARDVNVWFGAVLRGDTDRIEVGEGTNLQDGVVVHVDPGVPCRIGAWVTVGHRAIVHGATVGDGALIGMAATVMDGAVVGEGCLAGAGASVTPGTVLPPRTLAVGSPARVVRELSDDVVAGFVEGAERYVAKARAFAAAGWSVGAVGRPG